MHLFRRWIERTFLGKRRGRRTSPLRARLRLESLEERITPTTPIVTALSYSNPAS